jgi:15-cis-phytoene synthase
MTSDVHHCRASIAHHSKSFALASRLLPGRTADEAAIVYSWCRRADNAVDDGRTRTDQVAALARLRRELDAVYARKPQTEPELRAFQQVVHERAIPRAYPEELLHGMQMDLERDRYPQLDDLHLYGFRVAGTVGLMMCHVMGVSDRAAMRRAAHMGMAMQLTNICRDVIEDWHMGRLYLPEDLLAAAGAPDLAARLGGPFPDEAAEPVSRVVASLLRQADVCYRSGDEGVRALTWRCALAVRSARRIYAAIGHRVARRGCDVRAGRAIVPLAAKLRQVIGAATETAREAPWRLADRRAAGTVHASPPVTVIRFPGDVLPISGSKP